MTPSINLRQLCNSTTTVSLLIKIILSFLLFLLLLLSFERALIAKSNSYTVYYDKFWENVVLLCSFKCKFIMNKRLHKTRVWECFIAKSVINFESKDNYERCYSLRVRVFFFMYSSSTLTQKYKLLYINWLILLSASTSVSGGNLVIYLINFLSVSSFWLSS